jgi:hypothetical protein
MPNSKRVVIGILIAVMFIIFLNTNGRFASVIDVARQVVPSQPPIAPVPDGAGPSAPIVVPTAAPVAPSTNDGSPDGTKGDSGLLKPNELVLALDAIPGTDDGELARYDRDQFGPSWSDIDHNGCDQRNDTLTRDLTDVTYREGTHNCVVITGVLNDPFTGKVIVFAKAEASKVQIDHMVPLSWAWKNGASTWTDAERLALANDPANLTAVSGSANASKSDKGPSEWLPVNESYRCAYVTKFVHIVDSYELTIGEKDRMAARRLLAAC